MGYNGFPVCFMPMFGAMAACRMFYPGFNSPFLFDLKRFVFLIFALQFHNHFEFPARIQLNYQKTLQTEVRYQQLFLFSLL
jgi:hypothetical protein